MFLLLRRYGAICNEWCSWSFFVAVEAGCDQTVRVALMKYFGPAALARDPDVSMDPVIRSMILERQTVVGKYVREFQNLFREKPVK